MIKYISFRVQEKLYRSMGLSRFRWLGCKGSYLLGRLYGKHKVFREPDEYPIPILQ
jgi:hypothetical protein